MIRPLLFGTICAVFAIVACSSSKSTPCNQNPWECPAGQTCWPSSPTSFACLNSGPGQIGSTCQDSEGIATCGDGLACLTTSAASGTCTPYCSNTDPSHACPGGAACATATLIGSTTTFQVCVTSVLGSDGGQGSSSSSSAQSTSSASSGASSSSASSSGADAGSDASIQDSGIVNASDVLVF